MKLKQSYRITIKIKGEDTTHYVIRDGVDLKNMLEVIEYNIVKFEIESIKFVPIPDLEEVNHV